MARVDRLPPPVPDPIRSPAVAVTGEVEETIGSLEARVHVPASPRRAVVICHPHPLYGGSMHSPVPLSLAKTLADRASDTVAWARFNFRGVGQSGGRHDDGAGELDDALAVIAHLRARAPGVPVAACGHSFGSWIAMRAACASPGVDRVLMIAPSSRFFDFQETLAFAGPRTIFLGDQDEFCDVDEGRALAARLGATLRVFEGFDHHFTKSRRAVAEAALPVIAPEVEAQQP
jgi:alpha/beta superfamily hydrolase